MTILPPRRNRTVIDAKHPFAKDDELIAISYRPFIAGYPRAQKIESTDPRVSGAAVG